MPTLINPMNFTASSAVSTELLFVLTPTTPNTPTAIAPGAVGTVLTVTSAGVMGFASPAFTPNVNTISTATGTLVTDAQNFVTFAGACTATLPATTNTGDFLWIYSIGGSVVVAQNASQQIHAGATSSTAGVSGNLTLPNVYQPCTLVQTPTANNLIVGNLLYNASLT